MKYFMINLCSLLLVLNSTANDFFEKYCIQCHNNKKTKGKINLEKPLSFENMNKVLEELYSGNMPPDDELLPTEKERNNFIAYFQQRLPKQEAALRIMSKAEQEKLFQDIFKVSFKSQLPERLKNHFGIKDAKMDRVSTSYLEKLFKSNQEVLDYLYPYPKPVSQTWSHSRLNYFSTEGDFFVSQFENGILMKASSKVGLVPMWKAAVEGRYKVQISVEISGEVKKKQDQLSIKAYSFKNIQSPLEQSLSKKSQRFKAESQLKSFEFEFDLKQGYGIQLHSHGKIKYDRTIKDNKSKNGAKITSFKIIGPIDFKYDKWDAIFPHSKKEVTKNLNHFFTKILRREPLESDAQKYLIYWKTKFKESQNMDLAYKQCLQKMLFDPESHIIDDYTRAKYESRLTMALKGHFEKINGNGESFIRETLSKNKFFFKSLADDWLGLSGLDTLVFDPKEFRQYSPSLIDAQREEVYTYLFNLAKNNSSIKELIKSDYTYVNKALYEFYELNDKTYKESSNFQKVSIQGQRPGGLLSMSAIHTVTANAEKITSPIIRGLWVSEKILGIIPPDPPEGVEGVDPSIAGAKTVREILAKHKADPSCANCHKKFDGLGLTMEVFDSLGQMRTTYSHLHNKKSKKNKKKKKQILPAEKANNLVASNGYYGERFLKDINSTNAMIVTHNYKQFKLSLVSRIYEHGLQRSLSFKESLLLKQNIHLFKDNFQDLLVQIFKSKLFVGK